MTGIKAVNKAIQPMGPLQSEIPLPSLLLKGWPLIVTYLKDCFFTIHLQEKDREKFAFTCLLIIILNLLGDISGPSFYRECSTAPPYADTLQIRHWK